MITIIDYHMGNLGSIANMLKKVGVKALITSNPDDVVKASKLILPGVGAFDKAIQNLHQLNLYESIIDKVTSDQIPILGICLGMQLLTKGSEEGQLEGFGFIDAYANKFNFQDEPKLKVPHMGWNEIKLTKNSALIQDNKEESLRYYFVHSYAIECYESNDILSTTDYGYDFVSSFEKNNVLGCQFHPEKSHKFGIQLFKNFVEKY